MDSQHMTQYKWTFVNLFTKNTVAKSSTFLLVHSWSATSPNLGIRCTLLHIFASGIILQMFPPSLSFMGNILNKWLLGSSSLVNAVYHSTCARCFGTWSPVEKKCKWVLRNAKHDVNTANVIACCVSNKYLVSTRHLGSWLDLPATPPSPPLPSSISAILNQQGTRWPQTWSLRVGMNGVHCLNSTIVNISM